ncbi:expressed unknown protein [Seminavis robusta]|uniref:Uncharacterized protein n=1 Tax=Seminavis robusta TaxID=568900 RepID=A0A9N8DZS2_9STRA|nr:expressed unknown protein [Seminavis robusta]|eukprot:Sro508_g156800.1 n/a (300) ;mRNA; f:39807-40793
MPKRTANSLGAILCSILFLTWMVPSMAFSDELYRRTSTRQDITETTTSDTSTTSEFSYAADVESAPLPSNNSWLFSQNTEEIVYFVYASNPSNNNSSIDNDDTIERFNVTSMEFLPTIVLPETPTAFKADDEHLLVGFGSLAYEYNLDGDDAVLLFVVEELSEDGQELQISGFETHDDLIFINYSGGSVGYFACVDRVTLEVVDKFDGTGSWGRTAFRPHTAIDRVNRRIIGWDQGYSPQDMISLSYSAAGSLLETDDGPYHGNLDGVEDANALWLFRFRTLERAPRGSVSLMTPETAF